MNQLPEFIEDLLKNNYKINQRMIIKGSIKSKKFIAFNDIVISRKNLSSMLEVKSKNRWKSILIHILVMV